MLFSNPLKLKINNLPLPARVERLVSRQLKGGGDMHTDCKTIALPHSVSTHSCFFSRHERVQ